MGFVANFIRFLAVDNCENRLRFDKVTDSLKVGTFMRHSVVDAVCHLKYFISSSITSTKLKETEADSSRNSHGL